MSNRLSKRLKLITGLLLGVVCGVVVLRSAVSKSTSDTALTSPPVIAENNVKPQETAGPTVALPATQTIPANLPQIAENDSVSAADGKETIPSDGKETIPTDGKETIGKETLPPVGQLMPGAQPYSVNPNNGSPAIEYRNGNENPLLNPPNPQNVEPPVVSPETR